VLLPFTATADAAGYGMRPPALIRGLLARL